MQTRRFQQVQDNRWTLNKGETVLYNSKDNKLFIIKSISREYFNDLELYYYELKRINPEEGD